MQRASFQERIGWPDGPWDDEPDRIDWTDDTTGVACLMLRNHHGVWCGYAACPPRHPWHGLEYGEIPGSAHEAAHCELTYSGPCMDDERPMRERVCHIPQPGEPDDVWWLGFDCNHAYDRAPGMDAVLADIDIPLASYHDRQIYRDERYVASRVALLAQTIAAAA